MLEERRRPFLEKNTEKRFPVGAGHRQTTGIQSIDPLPS
jgi:hypothetical protein